MEKNNLNHKDEYLNYKVKNYASSLSHKDLERLETALREGGNPNGDDEFNRPLSCAAKAGQYDKVRLLIKFGADVDASQSQALINTAKTRHNDMIVMLVEQYQASIDNTEILMAAATAKRIKNINTLLNYGAAVNEDTLFEIMAATHKNHNATMERAINTYITQQGVDNIIHDADLPDKLDAFSGKEILQSYVLHHQLQHPPTNEQEDTFDNKNTLTL